jgi:uncharacterized protein (DUF1330 family)
MSASPISARSDALPMVLVALLTVRPDQIDKFRAYERQAAAVMAKHGGSIERAVEIPSEREGDPYREVHVISFPDEISYQAYTVDPDMANWRALREASVIRTEIMKGSEGPDYTPA